MIESVRTPEPRVQGQGNCPVCDFASRPATKEQTAFRPQPTTSFPTTSFPLVPEIRQRVSHPLIARADRTRTRDALFTRAQQHNQDKRIQQRSATMFAVYLCPTRNTLFFTTVKRAVRTHRCYCAESRVQFTGMTCGWSGTNKRHKQKKRKKGRKDGRTEGRTDGQTDGRTEGKKERRKEGKKERRKGKKKKEEEEERRRKERRKEGNECQCVLGAVVPLVCCVLSRCTPSFWRTGSLCCHSPHGSDSLGSVRPNLSGTSQTRDPEWTALPGAHTSFLGRTAECVSSTRRLHESSKCGIAALSWRGSVVSRFIGDSAQHAGIGQVLSSQ